MEKAYKSVIIMMNTTKIDWSEEGILKTMIIVMSTFLANTLNYLLISPILLKCLLLAMLLDILTGIYKSTKLGKAFSWRTLKIGLFEKLIYLGVFLGIAYIMKGMKMEYEWLVIALFNILVWSETYSFITNYQSGRTKKEIKEVDFISGLLKIIRTFFKNLITSSFKTISKATEEQDKDTEKEDVDK